MFTVGQRVRIKTSSCRGLTGGLGIIVSGGPTSFRIQIDPELRSLLPYYEKEDGIRRFGIDRLEPVYETPFDISLHSYISKELG